MSMPDVVRVGVLCVIYFATAKFGLSLDAVSGFAAAVWPPTGIALVALVLYGYRLWPGIALGAFLVNLSAGAPVLVAGGMALGNTLEALLGTVLLERVVGFRPALDRLRDVLGLIVLAAGLSTLVSATIGVTSGWLGGSIPTATYGDAWRTWWLGDALGDLVVAPLLFVWSRRGRVSLPRRWIAEAIVLLVAVGVLSLVVFDVLAPEIPLSRYLIFVALILVAMRLGPHGTVIALALRSAIAIWGTAQGFGPFAGPTLHESLFLLQTFMSVVAVTILVLAAAMTERKQAEATACEQRERFEVTLFSIGDAVIATDSQGRVTFLNPVAEALTGWPEAEALGKDITEVFQIVNEYTRQAVENPIARVIRDGGEWGSPIIRCSLPGTAWNTPSMIAARQFVTARGVSWASCSSFAISASADGPRQSRRAWPPLWRPRKMPSSARPSRGSSRVGTRGPSASMAIRPRTSSAGRSRSCPRRIVRRNSQ